MRRRRKTSSIACSWSATVEAQEGVRRLRVVAELVEAEEDALDHREEGPAYPQESASVGRANRRYKRFRWVPTVALGIGVVCLLCFAVLNLG